MKNRGAIYQVATLESSAFRLLTAIRCYFHFLPFVQQKGEFHEHCTAFASRFRISAPRLLGRNTKLPQLPIAPSPCRVPMWNQACHHVLVQTSFFDFSRSYWVEKGAFRQKWYTKTAVFLKCSFAVLCALVQYKNMNNVTIALCDKTKSFSTICSLRAISMLRMPLSSWRFSENSLPFEDPMTS